MPKRLNNSLPILLCALALSSAFAAKEALLIANADYSHFGKLPNPITDAQQLADVLRQIGFNVNVVENASKEAMLDALGDFEERLKASKGIAFFHYGGHGVQVDGKNFLIPADADIPDEKRVATRAVDFDEIMCALETSGSEANVVVLDACRDNPLPATAIRSATRGLSVVASPPKNSIIIYAAAAGSKAQDGLFTPTLAKALAVPGRAISDVMTDVRREVYDKSGGAQTPGEYNQLFEKVILSDIVSPIRFPAKPVNSLDAGADSVSGLPSSPGNGISLTTPLNSAEEVIRAFFAGLGNRDESEVIQLLDDRVDYYSSGQITKTKVMADIKADWKRWSRGSFRVSDFQSQGASTLGFVLDYELDDGKRPRSGKLNVTADVTGSPLRITRLKYKVIAAD